MISILSIINDQNGLTNIESNYHNIYNFSNINVKEIGQTQNEYRGIFSKNNNKIPHPNNGNRQKK